MSHLRTVMLVSSPNLLQQDLLDMFKYQAHLVVSQPRRHSFGLYDQYSRELRGSSWDGCLHEYHT